MIASVLNIEIDNRAWRKGASSQYSTSIMRFARTKLHQSESRISNFHQSFLVLSWLSEEISVVRHFKYWIFSHLKLFLQYFGRTKSCLKDKWFWFVHCAIRARSITCHVNLREFFLWTVALPYGEVSELSWAGVWRLDDRLICLYSVLRFLSLVSISNIGTDFSFNRFQFLKI